MRIPLAREGTLLCGGGVYTHHQISPYQGLGVSGGLPPPEAAYLRPVSERLLQAQASLRNVSLQELPTAEVKIGMELDSRVDHSQQESLTSISRAAQLQFLSRWERRSQGLLPPTPILLAPTSRVVDHVVDGTAVPHLVQRLVSEGHEKELRELLDKGPPHGKIAWSPPSTPVELVAGILRWSFLRNSDKERMRVSENLREWIATTLSQAEYASHPRLGGISAVGSLLSTVLGHHPTMLALGDTPHEIAALLPKSVKIVHEDESISTLQALPIEYDEPGHFSFTDRGPHVLFPSSFERVIIAGTERDALETRNIDILITGSTAVSGFNGLSASRIEQLGKTHGVVALSGFQRISSHEEIESYAAGIEALSRGGAKIGLCYSDSKIPTLEPLTLARVRDTGAISFIGMNSYEAVRVLERISQSVLDHNPLRVSAEQNREIDKALQLAHTHRPEWEDGHESPEWLFHSAALLQAILKIPLVRVRGKAADVIVKDKNTALDPSAVRDAMIVSRNLGTIKVASSSGLIASAEEIAFLANPVKGEYMAALHAISDQVMQDRGPHIISRLPFVGYETLSDGRVVFAVPPVEMYDKRGGTQSAGDTMDCVFILEILPLLAK